MGSVPSGLPAAERVRWLAELSDALDSADRLLPLLELRPDQNVEAIDLHVRIQAARMEVNALRLSRSLSPFKEKCPEWTERPPWQPADFGSS